MTWAVAARLRLRPAGPDDGAFLAEIARLAAGWRGDDAVSGAVVERYAGGFGRAGDAGVVAEGDDGPVGAAWFRLLARDAGGYGWVADDVPEVTVAVRPDARGRGLGTALVAALVGRAAAEGHRALALSVEPDNGPAVALYRRAGFAPAGDGRGGAVTMVLAIP